MNTAKAILTLIPIIGLVFSWLSIGVVIHKRLVGDGEMDGVDMTMVCFGPLLAVIIITFKLLWPFLDYIDSKVAALYRWRRISNEAEAAREISEAEPAFDPENYKPGQWKDQTWQDALKRQRSITSSSVTRSDIRIRRSGRRKKTNGQQ